jgi:hypothetical protein
MSISVAPDGSIFDRVGEFAFGDRGRISTLFFHDREGYVDSIFKFVQALASSKTLVGGTRPPLIDETAKLREQLIGRNCLGYSDFFEEGIRAAVEASALTWLGKHWAAITDELANPFSPASIAILGHASFTTAGC